MSAARFHARVEGRVQGVGFRFFVAQHAHTLGAQGWVRNRWDGSVEVVAEGPRETLDQLAAAVRRGPSGAFVSEAAVTWEEAKGEFRSFRIRSTG